MSNTVSKDLTLDSALHSRLQALSAIKEQTPDWLINAAIEEYVTREEQREREKAEDAERWARYRSTGQAIPHAEVEKWLASWGDESELPCPK